MLHIRCAGLPAISWPRNRMEPEVGFTTPVSILIMVLLPAPLGPIKAWIWPRWSRNDTFCAGLTPPYALVTPSTASNSPSPAGPMRVVLGGSSDFSPASVSVRPLNNALKTPATPPGITYRANSSRKP
ncbi:hypothetical protein D3C72_1990590 [compost metagenome]